MATSKLTHDRWATLVALEVLELIADQIETHGSADAADIEAVLIFLREIAHSCLDNTEKRLLLPLLEIEIGVLERARLGATIENHRRLAGLFDELERSHRGAQTSQFVVASRSYATALADLIFEEGQFLPAVIHPVSTHAQVQQMLLEFDRVESGIANQAQLKRSALRRLEAKYVSPHCI